MSNKVFLDLNQEYTLGSLAKAVGAKSLMGRRISVLKNLEREGCIWSGTGLIVTIFFTLAFVIIGAMHGYSNLKIPMGILGGVGVSVTLISGMIGGVGGWLLHKAAHKKLTQVERDTWLKKNLPKKFV